VPLLSASETLHTRARAFIDAPDPAGFDALALDLARFQAAHVPVFTRLVRARGVDLDAARTADAIPAVPTDVFRLARVAAHPPELDARVFRTSGTSQGAGARGEHPMRATATYEHAALAWGRAMLFADRPRLRPIVLAPSSSDLPDSSLSFMLDLFAAALGGRASHHVALGPDGSATIDADGVAAACASARAAGEAAIVLGTSFALVHLLDARGGRELALPPGSRVMQTGGFKGRSREVDAAELRRAVAAAFAVPERAVVGEYGMTELSSQLYEGTLARAGARPGRYHAPPWLRVTAVDPITLAPLAPGEVGLARFVDLANVDSAVAVQTADRVRVGPHGVELLGRAPGATPRGCSLAMDAMLEGA
jgi:hypothetical protein